MNPRSSKEARLRDRLREATRDAILVAAESVFASQGIHTARMEDIAAAAGVAVGTVYNYFPDRQGLLVAMLEAHRAQMVARIDAALAAREASPFAERLAAFVRAGFEHFEAHRPLFTLMLEEELNLHRIGSKRKPMMREIAARAERLVRIGVESGALRAEGEPLYPAMLLGMIRGALHRSLSRPEPLCPLVAEMTRFFLEGAGVRS